MSEYPNWPGVRSGSPETSADAAQSVASAAASREAVALKFITSRAGAGATADEVAEALEWDRYSARPRLSTLRARRKIVDSGERRKGASGRNQAVWIANEYAPSPKSLLKDQSEPAAMIGNSRDHKGQSYRVVDARARRRADGTTATILIWESRCADCGEAFLFSSPAASSKFQPNRRCQRHKRPGSQVKAAQ